MAAVERSGDTEWLTGLLTGEEEGSKQEGESKYQLNQYTEHEKENWKDSKRIVVYENDQQLLDFVEEAIYNKQEIRKIYIGKINDNLAARVLEKTGVNITNYNLALTGDEIRKIIYQHGTENEVLSGQKQIVSSDFLDIKKTIEDPDDIRLSEKEYMGLPVIEFEKNINGRTTVVAYHVARHMDLHVQTMYKGIKKEGLASAPSGSPDGAFSQTSETTTGTAPKGSSKGIISQADQKVNEKL